MRVCVRGDCVYQAESETTAELSQVACGIRQGYSNIQSGIIYERWIHGVPWILSVKNNTCLARHPSPHGIVARPRSRPLARFEFRNDIAHGKPDRTKLLRMGFELGWGFWEALPPFLVMDS